MQNYPNIRKEREKRKLTQAQIADVLNTSQKQYSRWETGDRAFLIEDLIALAKFYGVTTDYLLGLSDER